MSVTVYEVIVPIILLALAWVAVFAWRYINTPSARVFAQMVLCVMVWLVGDLYGRLAVRLNWQLFSEDIKYLGVTTAPVLMLMFTRSFLERPFSRRAQALLLSVPALTVLMVWTNTWHGLFWQSVLVGVPSGPPLVRFGWYFWLVHFPYSYALIFLSLSLVVREGLRSTRLHQPQFWTLGVAFAVPFLANVAYLSGLTGGVSYTALSFAICMAFLWSVLRQGLLRSNPIAYQTVFQTVRDGVIVLDRSGRISDVNPAAARALAHNRESLIGQTLRQAFTAWPTLLERFEQTLEADEEVLVPNQEPPQYVNLQITPLYSKVGTLLGRVITMRDVSEGRRRQQFLEDLAFQDPLTGLANRRSFEHQAEQAIESARADGTGLAILYFDLDGFKRINDSFGHDVGDTLLRAVAGRVQSCLRDQDLLARMGGDEFSAMVKMLEPGDVAAVAQRISETVCVPYQLAEQTLSIGLSLGVAIFPDYATDLKALLRHADAAMYVKKLARKTLR
jgi:diguanylate cyclase (GGDEF)-like protein/PAS domain S-box-containing protein